MYSSTVSAIVPLNVEPHSDVMRFSAALVVGPVLWWMWRGKLMTCAVSSGAIIINGTCRFAITGKIVVETTFFTRFRFVYDLSFGG